MAEIAKSPGGFFFVWTLWALGGLGASPCSSRRAWTVGSATEAAPVVQQRTVRFLPIGCCNSNDQWRSVYRRHRVYRSAFRTEPAATVRARSLSFPRMARNRPDGNRDPTSENPDLRDGTSSPSDKEIANDSVLYHALFRLQEAIRS